VSDVRVPDDLIRQREKAIEAEALWRKRFLETLEHFPFVPFGCRVVVLQRQHEHVTKGGLLLPQTKDAPLSGFVVAVPALHQDFVVTPEQGAWRYVRGFESVEDGVSLLFLGDEVLFPDHSAQRISVMVGLPGEEQRPQEFLVLDARELHGKVIGGRVEAMKDLVPGLDAGDPIEGEALRDIPPD